MREPSGGQAPGEVDAELHLVRIILDQLLANGDRPFVTVAGLGDSPLRAEEIAEGRVVRGELVSVRGGRSGRLGHGPGVDQGVARTPPPPRSASPSSIATSTGSGVSSRGGRDT